MVRNWIWVNIIRPVLVWNILRKRKKYGEVGKMKTSEQCQREIARFSKMRMKRHIIVQKSSDNAMDVMMKSLDATNYEVMRYTLNWVVGKVAMPPSEFMLTNIKARKKADKINNDFRKFFKVYLEHSGLSKEYLIALLAKVANIPMQIKVHTNGNMDDDKKVEEATTEEVAATEEAKPEDGAEEAAA